mmetsp:Transcript_59914/g.69995  ORF Transcript_59914/g.69995 Transcript_59914/m.69995 type:complete len:141 (+) Transcript_59914:306-728(+)|eukprot:CAMPEP_0194355962 /NCGR_PEP_ID=MMETSP0174-20130528/3800_1 /TAXON_ID=216777 /ORGANISM="Proboscia alata, Strain PI-D3" /LENGTH=140 /DNA_ID=CAMNT_0039125459 /DNA_START=287 /DNA_END=709 /DNA_ORIENTATION=-
MSDAMVGEGAIQSRRTVYVGGIADGATEATIRAAFVPFGPIKSIDIPRDYAKGTHRGFCFIEFDEPEDASEAIYNADGAEILGRALSVNLAQAHKHKLGSIKAVWTSDDWFREQSGETKEKEVGEEEERMKEDATILKDK